MELINKLGGRKLILAVVSLIIGVVVYFVKGIDANFLGLLLGIPGLFSVGNAAEHIAGAVKARPQQNTEVAKSLEKSLETINRLNEQNAALLESVATVQQTLSYIITVTGLDRPQQVNTNDQTNR